MGCNGSVINCIACQTNFYADASTGINVCLSCPSGCPNCISKTLCGTCAAGYYKSDVGGCLKCDPSCQTCNGSLAANCITCVTGLQFSNGNCLGCLSSCLSCSAPTICSACPAGKILINGSCLDQCPERSFQNGTSCSSCDITCKTCSNGSSIGCTTCSDAYPYRDRSACVAACNSTSFVVNGQCTLCHGTVYMLSTLCCLYPKVVINSQCIPS